MIPPFSAVIWREACNCSPQSQRLEPKRSPVIHSEWIRTRMGSEGLKFSWTKARWGIQSSPFSFLENAIILKFPHGVGIMASACFIHCLCESSILCFAICWFLDGLMSWIAIPSHLHLTLLYFLNDLHWINKQQVTPIKGLAILEVRQKYSIERTLKPIGEIEKIGIYLRFYETMDTNYFLKILKKSG